MRKFVSEVDDYLVSIDKIETVTGYDFLPGLEDAHEKTLEEAIAKK